MVAKNPVKPIHITQIRHSLYNPTGDEESENCGPTSLTMACLFLGVSLPAIPGFSLPRTVQEKIDSARFWMFAQADGTSLNPEKDGIMLSGSGPARAPSEHMTLVNLPDLERGAQNLGLSSIALRLWSEVRNATPRLGPTLLAGDPSQSAAYAEQLEVSYQGGHVIFLADCHKDHFLVCDPLSHKGPTWVSQSLLEDFASTAPFGDVLGLNLFR